MKLRDWSTKIMTAPMELTVNGNIAGINAIFIHYVVIDRIVFRVHTVTTDFGLHSEISV